MKKAGEWFDEGKLFFDDSGEDNKRKAHCKVSGINKYDREKDYKKETKDESDLEVKQ